MRNLTMALCAAAVALAACDPSSTDTAPPVCTPAPFTTPFPASAAIFCTDFYGAICQRAFSDCGAQLTFYTSNFSDEQACSDYWDWFCNSYQDNSRTGVNGGCAGLCILSIQTEACTIFTGGLPMECSNATGEVPLPPPACTESISAGTTTGTIADSDPIYDGGHAKTYCLALSAGQVVTIGTSAPTSGAALGDSVLHLFSPAGIEVAYDDDSGVGFYSLISSYTVPTTGTYSLVVRGYSLNTLGSFQLTVTIN